MPFSFLHAADLHLDTPFASVGGFPDEVAATLREASLRAWDALVSTAIEREVAFVLLAGDIYDGAERGIRAQRAFLDGVTRMADRGIRTFLVHGNHDPVGQGWTAIDAFPDLVHQFAASKVESVEFEAGGERVVVHGISYATSAMEENLSLRFPRATGGGFQIGLLHANVGGSATGHQDYSPCSVDDLRRPGYQYWALGHVHKRHNPLAGEPWAVYPGNLQGRTTRPSEQGAKGAVVVEVDHGIASAPELVVLDQVRFADVAVSIDQVSDVGTLLAALERDGSPARHHGRAMVVRATIEGSGPLHHELTSPRRRAEIIDELRRSGAASMPFVWWNQVVWKTRPAGEVVDLRRRDDFVSDLVRFMDDTTPQDRSTWADLLPADVLRELGDLLPDGDDALIWQAAQAAALDAVTGASS
jgi:DNA repair exonuclease SbcCD nuclease subunit